MEVGKGGREKSDWYLGAEQGEGREALSAERTGCIF